MARIPYDIVAATAVMLVIAAALGYAGMRLARRRPRLASGAAVVTVIAMLAQALWWHGNLWLTRIVPLADAIVWTYLSAPLAALLAGVAWVRLPGPTWQRIICAGLLVGIGLWRQVGPVIGSPPPMSSAVWIDDICHQSSTSSCSAAAAATLLNARGIMASEAEMIENCLTHADGTTDLGLYRGLKIKCAGTGWQPRAGRPGFDALRDWPAPVIISIGITSGGVLEASVGHSIVIFAFNDDGTIDVGDPLSGRRQTWRFEELKLKYQGGAICLVASGAPPE